MTPALVMAASTPRARVLARPGGYMVPIRARVAGTARAAPMPWTVRAATSGPVAEARPATGDPATNSASPSTPTTNWAATPPPARPPPAAWSPRPWAMATTSPGQHSQQLKG